MNEIYLRRSVRKFLDKKVEPEKIEKLLRAAMQAPSAKNQQPWHFIVIDEETQLDSIRTIRGGAKHLYTAPLVIVLAVGPDLIANHSEAQDMGCATQNLMLQAVALDIGTIWIGTYSDKETMSEVRKISNLPENYEPYVVLGVGYPDGEGKRFIDRYKKERRT